LELDTQLEIARELNYLDAELQEKMALEVYQVLGLLNRLIESLRPKLVQRSPAQDPETLKP
jgi:hypothetical protein